MTPLVFPHTSAPDHEGDDINEKIEWYGRIQIEHGLSTVWSDFSVYDFNKVPFPEAKSMAYQYMRSGWGEDNDAPVPANATWLDLWKVANELVLHSRDLHHIFVERLELQGSVLVLMCGS